MDRLIGRYGERESERERERVEMTGGKIQRKSQREREWRAEMTGGKIQRKSQRERERRVQKKRDRQIDIQREMRWMMDRWIDEIYID